MDYTLQFKGFVKSTVRKNTAVLPNLTQKEIETECWAALAVAIHRWDGSKGKLSSWVYAAVTGRMKDLRKRPASQPEISQEYSEFSVMDNDAEIMDQANDDDLPYLDFILF